MQQNLNLTIKKVETVICFLKFLEAHYKKFMGVVRQREETKNIEFRKEVVTLSLFTHKTNVYIENPNSKNKQTNNYLNSYVNLVRFLDPRSICKNQLYFYILAMNISI